MPTSMSGGDGGGGGRGSTGLGVAGREDPSRKTKKKPNRPTDRGFRGNPAVGNPITPVVPNPSMGMPSLTGGTGMGSVSPGSAGAPAVSGGMPAPPTTANFTAPWGTTYSSNDQTAMLSDPMILLQELLASQGLDNPTNAARYGDVPYGIANLLPLLNGGQMDVNGQQSLDLVSQLLGNQATPGAGSIDLATVLQTLLASGGQDPNSMMGAIGSDPEQVDRMMQAIIAMANPMMAPYLEMMFKNAQGNYGQAQLDVNGGQQMGPYSQWLASQLGM